MTDNEELVAGRYRLGERIGSGAMGVVWRAHDERLRRTVAIKQLFRQPGLDERQAGEARERAFREARIAARLQHPNVVVVYDVVEHDDAPWLVMEYVPSRSLAAALRAGPLPPERVVGIGAQAAAGLAAAHAVGVVHRDVKPGNVLIGDDGIVKIADFGISRATGDVVLTATGLLSGTPAYLAPELAKGEQPTQQSDVFALGATLYAAVEGEPPFGRSDNALALLHVVANGVVPRPTRAGSLTLPLMSLLSPDPADRPTMREAHAELAGLVDRTDATLPVLDPSRAWTTPVLPSVPSAEAPLTPPAIGPTAYAVDPAGEPVESTQRTRPPRRQRRLRLLVTGVVLVVAAGATLFVLDRAGHGTPSIPSAAGLGGSPAVAGTSVAPTITTTAPPVTHVTLATMSDTVTDYYALLPDDVTAAYRMLAAAYRAVHPLADVRAFYQGIESVSAGDFTQVGPNTVDATITFVTKSGVTTHEAYEFRVVARGGRLVIQDAVQLGRTAGT